MDQSELPPAEYQILLSPEAYAEFTRLLEKPPSDLPKLRRLLRQPSVFEADE